MAWEFWILTLILSVCNCQNLNQGDIDRQDYKRLQSPYRFEPYKTEVEIDEKRQNDKFLQKQPKVRLYFKFLH